MLRKQYINKGNLKKMGKMRNIGKKAKSSNLKEAKADDTRRSKNKIVKYSSKKLRRSRIPL